MDTSIKVGIFCESIFCILMLILEITGFFKDTFTAIVFPAIFLSVIPLALIPCLCHIKTSRLSVIFLQDCIQVIDKAGKCRREIPYNTISSIRAEEVAGFFYGKDNQQAKQKYICVFLNGCTAIPDTTYAKLFEHEHFFMFHYDSEALDLLLQKAGKQNAMGDPPAIFFD